MSPLHTFLSETAARALPRILTQICRDPGAPFYGACDRNWWHYKIRDFPSIITQQAGYALHIASKLETSALRPPASDLRHLAAASARFWNHRAILHGAFEEYYPYEQGYPPVAFSTLAAAKLCHEKVVPLSEIRPGLAIAAKQLLTRFEAQAANQQIAGTAALSVIRSLDPSLIEETQFQKILTRILDLQHPEGWFPEYDGPDLGYLAVSIDCLWDIHDHTADPRALPAIRKAAGYIAWFANNPIGAAGMHNSRNTDYFTPYGLVRLAVEENNPQAAATVEKLFTRQAQENSGQLSENGDRKSEIGGQGAETDIPQSPISNTQSSFHFFDAVDDRYWCHYIGHSVFRALDILEKEAADQISSGASSSLPPEKSQPGSGHALITSPAGATALVSTRKGAILTARWPDNSLANDFGWLVQTSERLFVSHWWSPEWKTEITADHASCEGYLVSHKEHISSPLKHLILRVGSFFLGRHLIPILKRLVIFKKNETSLRFSRQIRWEGETLVIRDEIEGLRTEDKIERAPRTSKRHVASADSYHPEDLALLAGAERQESIDRSDGTFRCESRYRLAVSSRQ